MYGYLTWGIRFHGDNERIAFLRAEQKMNLLQPDANRRG